MKTYDIYFKDQYYQQFEWQDVIKFFGRNRCPANTPVKYAHEEQWRTLEQLRLEREAYSEPEASRVIKDYAAVSSYSILWVCSQIFTALAGLGGLIGVAYTVEASGLAAISVAVSALVSMFLFQVCRVVIEAADGVKELLQKRK